MRTVLFSLLESFPSLKLLKVFNICTYKGIFSKKGSFSNTIERQLYQVISLLERSIWQTFKIICGFAEYHFVLISIQMNYDKYTRTCFLIKTIYIGGSLFCILGFLISTKIELFEACSANDAAKIVIIY